MMGRYAQGTSVSVERSIMELRRVLQSHGADGFAYAEERGCAEVGFILGGHTVRLGVPLPNREDPCFTRTATGRWRKENQLDALYVSEVRRRWRVLVIASKAKLELIEAGCSTVAEEFLSRLVLPNGQTVAQRLGPDIGKLVSSGRMPKLLPSSLEQE